MGRTYAELGRQLPPRRDEAKALSPDVQAWVKGLDVPESDQGAKLMHPYVQSAWIYVAVTTIADSLAQIPFRISRLREDKARRVRAWRYGSDPKQRQWCRRELQDAVVESGAVVDLFEQPHPSMNKTLFWSQVASWDCLRGEFFVLPLDGADEPVDLSERAPRVDRMLTLDTGLFWHVVTGYRLDAWRYTGTPIMSPLPSEMLTPGEVIHDRSVNPYLYWRGLSPLVVAMLPASADYAAEMFQKGLLMNNADTGIIATTEQNLTAEQREQFMAALRERKRKAGTPDRPLFLSSGVTIQKPTISNVDMQFLETRRLLRQEIGAIYKVPESLMGFSENKQSALSGGGAALEQEKRTFVENTLQPKCHRYESAVGPIIRSFDAGLVGWFDIDGLPIMQEARRARLDAATKVFSMGVPFNRINEVYDLGFAPLAWGDRGYLPFSLQPAESVGEEEMPSEGEDGQAGPGGRPPGEEDESLQTANGEEDGGQKTFVGRARGLLAGLQQATDKASSKELWESHMRQRVSTVKGFEGKVRRVLAEFRKSTLGALERIAPKGTEGTEGTRGTKVRSLVDLIFDPGVFGRELMVQLTPVMSGALQDAADLLRKGELGLDDPWKFPPQQALEFVTGRTQPVQDCGMTVRNQLNTALEAGITAGEPYEQLAGRVKGVFNDLADYEAHRIALTETTMSFNFSRDVAMREAKVPFKGWLSSHGPTVRPAHAAAEARYRDNPIPLDQPFDVGGEELMYPGDPNGSPENVINCHCIQLAKKAPKLPKE